MKIQRRWKPGGRPRRRNTTKKWMLQRQELLGGKDTKRLLSEPPLVLSKRFKKGA